MNDNQILYHIDFYSRYERVIRIIGWSSKFKENANLTIQLGNVKAVYEKTKRPDLVQLFGPDSINWGFDAIFIYADGATARLACAKTIRIISIHGEDFIQNINYTSGDENNYIWESKSEQEFIFFEELRKHSNPKVLEIGSRARSGVIRKAKFEGTNYTGVDVLQGPNVDIVCDAHELSNHVSSKYDFVYSVSVFEHLLMPWKVVVELAKCMNNGGFVFTQTHNAWPIHDAPWDYWRYTTDSFASIFNKYTGFEIVNTSYRCPCNFATVFDNGSPLTNFTFQASYLMVCCLARKTNDPMLSWDVTPAMLTETMYPL